jgi:2-polyprenyl-3-methyl-5-hydroxy-6-metoxy-1,4-benzoquinol methylase
MSTSCRLCDSTGTALMFEKEGVEYFRCLACRLVFSATSANPNLENLIEDYEPSYVDYLRETPEDAAHFRSLLAWMGRFTSVEGRRLLDVGSGGGKWVRHLRRQSVEARGLEPSRALYQHFLARDAFFSPDFPENFASSHAEAFDIATAFDVLEHVERPGPFLEALARMLRPGGLLFISTPDVSSLLARVAGKRWHYYNRYHLCFFDRQTLSSAAQARGLRPIGFSRRGRHKSLRYLFRYWNDFVLKTTAVRASSSLPDVVLPVNLFDTMDLCFVRDPAKP